MILDLENISKKELVRMLQASESRVEESESRVKKQAKEN